MSIAHKEELQIGIAKITYFENGQIRSAQFQPTIAINAAGLGEHLGQCTGKTVEEVQGTAEILLGTFFNKVSEIELADREKYAVKSRTLYASAYQSTHIKEIAIEFYFTEI